MLFVLRAFVICSAALLMTGCVARTIVDVVTFPIDVASAGVDAVTTSQSEADEKRGRELRKAEEKAGRDARKAEEAERERREREAEGQPPIQP